MAQTKNYIDDDNDDDLTPNLLHHNFEVDASGRPAGGRTLAQGLIVEFQKGPVKPDVGPNGAFVEDLIRTAIARLEWYQESEFACHENVKTITALNDALDSQKQRTRDRRYRGVEGTYIQ